MLSVSFDYIYPTKYLELWKVTICRTTELSIVYREHVYLSLEIKWNNLHDTYSISISLFFIRRPVFPVARLKAVRALKLSRLESFRALTSSAAKYKTDPKTEKTNLKQTPNWMKNWPLTDLLLLKNRPMATKVKVGLKWADYIIYVKIKMTFTNTTKATDKY